MRVEYMVSGGKNLKHKAIIFLALLCSVAFVECGRGPHERSGKPGSESRTLTDTTAAISDAEHPGIPQPPKPIDDMTKEEREAYKQLLKKSGHYLCCISPSCTMCLYEEDLCQCEKAVRAGDPVCGECFKGWKKGKGAVEGINPKDVKKL